MKPALLAALVVAGLVLSGCAASDDSGGSSSSLSSSKRTTSKTTTATSTPAPGVTQTQTTTVTVTQTPTTVPTTTPAPPPPPPTPSGPADTSSPIVNDTATTSVSDTFAQVAWNVSDNDPAVASRVEYGAGAGNFSGRTPDLSGAGSHAQGLLPLHSCTDYSFRVSAVDRAGNTGIGLPSPATFHTAGAAPTVSSVAANDVMHTSMKIVWTIAGPGDTQSQLMYGTSALTTSTPFQTGAGIRSVVISGLAQNTVYNYQVHVVSPCGNTDSAVKTQRTAQLILVDINGNYGSINSFSPGSGSALSLVYDHPYVFQVKNKDTMTHTFNIEPIVISAYNSGDIPAGTTYTFPASITFPTAGTSFEMRCSYHNSGPSPMKGTIHIT